MDVLRRELDRLAAEIVIAEDAEPRRLPPDAALRILVAALRRLVVTGGFRANEEAVRAVPHSGNADRREYLDRLDCHGRLSDSAVVP